MALPFESRADIAARFDGRAGKYDQSAMHRRLATAVAGAVAGSQPRPMNVLDVATGTGLVLRALAALPTSDDLTMTGIDISDGMLAVARAELPSAQFINSDAAALPFEDASFDLVTCVTALHLLPDASAALREWRRVLRPDGRIVTASFSVAPVQNSAGHGTTEIERHARFGSRDALESFAASADLRLSALQFWTAPPAAEHHDECLIAEFLRV
jgi:ubiquinone/menaquinone biosynthesis C-methylase UbiE